MRTLRRPAQTALPTTLPRVNLLPPEIAEAVRFQRIQGGLGLGILAALLIVGLLYLGAKGGVEDANTRVQTATAEKTQVQREITAYADVTAKYAAAAAAQQMLVQAMGSEVRYSRFLNDLSLSMPEDVWLKSATWAQTAATTGTAAAGTAATGTGSTPAIGSVTLSGVAKTHDDVAVWLELLAAQKGYDAPYLQSSTEVLIDKTVVVNWSTTVALTPAALSGRYTKVGS